MRNKTTRLGKHSKVDFKRSNGILFVLDASNHIVIRRSIRLSSSNDAPCPLRRTCVMTEDRRRNAGGDATKSIKVGEVPIFISLHFSPHSASARQTLCSHHPAQRKCLIPL